MFADQRAPCRRCCCASAIRLSDVSAFGGAEGHTCKETLNAVVLVVECQDLVGDQIVHRLRWLHLVESARALVCIMGTDIVLQKRLRSKVPLCYQVGLGPHFRTDTG